MISFLFRVAFILGLFIFSIVCYIDGNIPVFGITFFLWLVLAINYIKNGTVSHAFYYIRKNKPFKAENTLKYTFWPKLLGSKSTAYFYFTKAYLAMNKKNRKNAEIFFNKSVTQGNLSKKDFQIAYLNLTGIAIKDNNYNLATEYFRLLSTSGSDIVADLKAEYEKLKKELGNS